MATSTRICCWFLASILLASSVVCQHSSLSLRGDGGKIVWKDDNGGHVVSLKRNASVLEIDGPLVAKELHVGNVSISDGFSDASEMMANLTAQLAVLRSKVADLRVESEMLASPWHQQVDWFDLAATVNPSLKGYIGVFAHGDFVYYAPYPNDTEHGNVVRISMSDFSSSGVEWFDLAATVNGSLKGYAGCFAAGEFGYYVPFNNGAFHGNVVRINLSDFSPSGVEWFDLKASVHSSLAGYTGGFADGEYAYYVPLSNDSEHGNVVRINMSDFSPSGVEWFDMAAAVDAGLKGYHGGFAAGGFAYYAPYTNFTHPSFHGKVVRINASDFSPSGVEWFDASSVHPGLVGFSGAFAVEDFAYYVPYSADGGAHGRVMRINMSDFSPSGVEWFRLETTVFDGLVGFGFGFTDGLFGYYVPFNDGGLISGYHGRVVRIDLSNFSPSGVEWFDLATRVDASLVGFLGGFAAGGFAYLSPYYDGSGSHGNVVRIALN